MATHPALTWNFSQVFGDRAGEGVEIAEADIISAVEFNHDGEYLATGDKGGRVVLFERNNSGVGSEDEFRFFTEFQSHEPEFDYLKSLEIEEKINQIKWLQRRNHAHFLITTNDKTIKLWKVSNRPYFAEPEEEPAAFGAAAADPKAIKVPVMKQQEVRTEARAKRVFANAHAYHINSISVNSDDETFISADDLRVNLWNLGVNDQSFNIVDIKPPTMEELTEVITAARFHPQHCNIFMYSSSKGAIKMCDMRAAALCDAHAKAFEEPADPASRSFFSDIIASTSDIEFSNSGTHFLSRDYLSIKIWDARKEGSPVQSFDVHDFLRPKLCDLYENDCIFDKFDACWSNDDQQILAGSYHNLFRMYDIASCEDVCLEASRDNIGGPMHTLQPVQLISGGATRTSRQQIHVEDIDFNFKILHAAWHPSRNILALAATNNLYLYHR
mmetsp:Transcript_31837/g.83425  ORF Transcript_31837/g.83425 Transcript_31837/m.83425 type:complete len:443 (+) Transcript_31837:419-1747(+)